MSAFYLDQNSSSALPIRVQIEALLYFLAFIVIIAAHFNEDPPASGLSLAQLIHHLEYYDSILWLYQSTSLFAPSLHSGAQMQHYDGAHTAETQLFSNGSTAYGYSAHAGVSAPMYTTTQSTPPPPVTGIPESTNEDLVQTYRWRDGPINLDRMAMSVHPDETPDGRTITTTGFPSSGEAEQISNMRSNDVEHYINQCSGIRDGPVEQEYSIPDDDGRDGKTSIRARGIGTSSIVKVVDTQQRKAHRQGPEAKFGLLGSEPRAKSPKGRPTKNSRIPKKMKHQDVQSLPLDGGRYTRGTFIGVTMQDRQDIQPLPISPSSGPRTCGTYSSPIPTTIYMQPAYEGGQERPSMA
ncbi:hypothetical protein CVT25_008273 [Psilocybe cyanescens]|uniref:Uncharacterized protein n=1 Tax=Psilocybe cyanescens TaxID=93625 RepID=A0A409XMT3_PSICY|nr:hypothetical protein CVT25_008273 [Psilocybe cyanescens]